MSPENPYESETLLAEYLFFHYGDPAAYLPWDFGPQSALNYPERCVSECFDHAALPGHGRGLDIGCAVGRSSFALARHCSEVIGIDYSGAFVRAAQALAAARSLDYAYPVEGRRTATATASLPADVDPERVRFEQGDAMNLRPDLGSFDAVLAANLICRLARPQDFLQRCRDLVKPGGQLVITTPFTWLESYTPPAEWIGAHPESGESLEVLRQSLDPDFDLDWTGDLPFLIREHRRKFQWSVAQACRFIRRT